VIFFDSSLSLFSFGRKQRRRRNKFTSYPKKSLLAVSIPPQEGRVIPEGFPSTRGGEFLRVTKGKIFNLSGSNITRDKTLGEHSPG